MKCSKCGKEIANDSNFCEYCGVNLNLYKEKKLIRRKIILYSFLSFLCIALLFIACYTPGLEAGYRVTKLGDTWGFNTSRDLHFIINWKIKSPVALAWLGLLISYPITYFKLKGGVSDIFNWGDDAPGASGMSLIIAIVGIGLLIRTSCIAEEKDFGIGFWLMLCVIIVQLFSAYRLWSLSAKSEHQTSDSN